MIDRDTRRPDPEKVESIKAFPEPLSRIAVQRFLGLTGYYRDLVEDYGAHTAALRALTKDDVLHLWSKLDREAKGEFGWLKEETASDRVVLLHPDRDAEFITQTDVCAESFGAILAQKYKDPVIGKVSERPIRYAFRALQSPGAKWATRKQELLGVVWACEKRHNYLWGRPFRIQADHANLRWLETSAPTKERLSRWACRLAEFEYTRSTSPERKTRRPTHSLAITFWVRRRLGTGSLRLKRTHRSNPKGC